MRYSIPFLLCLPLLATESLAFQEAPPSTSTTLSSKTATSEEIAELVSRGRALIAEGKAEEARALLETADAADKGALRTRMWLVRALIELNHLNDALDMTDELAAGGKTGPELDYLYGMSFVYKARKYIQEGVNLQMVGMHFGDGMSYLASATSNDPVKYADAYLPLAEAAWNSQELETARTAAQNAVALATSGAPEAFMLGEVAFSQFIVANGDAERVDEADAHWNAAFEAFQRAVTADGSPRTPALRYRLARAHKKSADALVWKSRLDEAGEQYALAMGWDPSAVDFGQVFSSLGAESFRPAIETGSKAFEKHHADKDTGDAQLLWWLGWARFAAKEYDAAREAYELSYGKWPAYVNCKWYIGLCQYHRQDYDAATASILENFSLDVANLAGSINGNPDFNQSILNYLVGKCAREGSAASAAKLSEAQAIAAQSNSLYWNNAGLFYRDAGDNVPVEGDEANLELQAHYYGKALSSYESALALEPENPALLNDTAVILHYCLVSDLQRARSMYLKSQERAVAELERADLSEEVRQLYAIAKRDSADNLRKLDALIERMRREAEGVGAPADGDAAGQ